MANSDPERRGLRKMIRSYIEFGTRSSNNTALSPALSTSHHQGIASPSQVRRTIVLHSLGVASMPLLSRAASPPSHPTAPSSASVSSASQATPPPSQAPAPLPALVSPALQVTCQPSQTTAQLPDPVSSTSHNKAPLPTTRSPVFQVTASLSPAISSTPSISYPPHPRVLPPHHARAPLSPTTSQTSGNTSNLPTVASRRSQCTAPSSVAPSPTLQTTALSPPAIFHSSQSAPAGKPYPSTAGASILSTLPANTPEELWEKAFEKLSPQDRDSIRSSTISSKIEILSQIIQITHERRKQYDEKKWKISYGGKTVVIRDAVDKIIGWIEKFKSIGNVAVSADAGDAALPWAAFRFLLMVVGEDSARMASVFVVLESLIGILVRCEIYEGLYLKGVRFSLVFEHLENALVVLYAAILAFLAKAKRFYETGTAGRIITEIFDVEGFQPSIDKINKAEVEANKMVIVVDVTVKSSQHQQLTEEMRHLRDLLEDIEEPIVRIDDRVATILVKFDEARRTQVLTWISRIPYKKHHDRAREGRVNITGEWLLERDVYKQWYYAKDSTILWLHGIPGAGKTKLTSLVIDVHLEELQSRTHSEGFAYFYCNRKEQDRRDPASIFRALLKQLSIHPRSRALYVPIVEEYDLGEKDGFASGDFSLDQCKAIIIQLLNLIPKTTIIIDGLDECDLRSASDEGTRDDLLDALQELVRAPVGSLVKVFISSRDDHDIMKAFRMVPNLCIGLTDNAKEIGVFVDMEVTKMIATGKLLDGNVKPALKDKICTALKSNAHGMFLWVDLQIKMLCSMSMESDVVSRLGSLPASLKEAYQDIFVQRIDKEEGSGQRLAYLAMMWMLCSAGPLSPNQLVMGSVSALRVESPSSSAIGSDVSIKIILKLCHNLVVIDRQLDVMRFAHLSVQEFLENRWDQKETNRMAATVCLSILLKIIPQEISSTLAGSETTSPYTKSKHRDDSERDKNRSNEDTGSVQEIYQRPFVYAFQQWHTHVILCGDIITSPKVVELLKRFLGTFEQPSDAFINWLKTYESLESRDDPKTLDHHKNFICSPPSVMPTVCYYGFIDIIADMWTSAHSFDVSMVNGLGHPLLSIASGRGNEWIVSELLNRGAQVDQFCGWYEVALNYAAEQGKERAFQLLMNNGADINRVCRSGATALTIATHYGHDRIALIILKNGGQQNIEPAMKIASRGQPGVLQVLLEYCEDRSPDAPLMFSCLAFAAEFRKLDCLKLLSSVVKENNTRYHKLDALASNTLAAAVRGGSRDMVKMVCREFAGADMDLRSQFWGKTALQYALELRFHDVTNFLLLQGAKFENLGRIELDGLGWAYGAPWYAELTRWIYNLPPPSSFTPAEALGVRKMFRKTLKLPVSIVDRILDLSEYWVMTESEREETVCIDQHDDRIPYISLPIKSHLRFPVRKIIFTICSHDQGWTTEENAASGQGSYHASSTWFEAAVHQSKESETPGHVIELQRNRTATREAHTHIITWDYRDNQSVTEWMGSLATGCFLGVYPRAEYPGWENTVKRMGLQVFVAWGDSESELSE